MGRATVSARPNPEGVDNMITVISSDEATIWQPAGDLDNSTVDHARRTLDAIASEPRAVLDLRNVGFIDSAGLGALIRALRRARRDGRRIVICCGQPPLLRLFETVGLDDLVAIEPDHERALASLRNVSAPL